MKLLKILILIIFVTLSVLGCKAFDDATPAVPIAAVSGKVVKVIDGDTIHVLGKGSTYKIRLAGIDAPERSQAFGKRAREKLVDLVAGKQVIAIVESKDRYGRYVAKVNCASQDVSAEMLRAGYAWHYAQYSGSNYYADLMKQAKRQRLGLWVDKHPQAPWDYRKEQRSGQ